MAGSLIAARFIGGNGLRLLEWTIVINQIGTPVYLRAWTVWNTQCDPLHNDRSHTMRFTQSGAASIMAQARIIASALTGMGRGFGLYTASPGRIARPLIAQKPDVRARALRHV